MPSSQVRRTVLARLHTSPSSSFPYLCLSLGRSILPSFGLDPSLVLGLVVHKKLVGLGLGGAVGVGIVQEVLNAEEHLLDGDRGPPPLLLVEDGEADGAGGVDVGMEQGRDELALGRLGWVLLGELEGDLVNATGPVGVLLPGDAGLPLHEVGRAVPLGFRPGVEAEGVIPAPVFALLQSRWVAYSMRVRGEKMLTFR